MKSQPVHVTRTPGLWRAEPDGHGDRNPYWRGYRIYAGELLIGEFNLTNTHTDAEANLHAIIEAINRGITP